VLAFGRLEELEWTLRELRGRSLVVGKVRGEEARLRRATRPRACTHELTKSES
jgi:hypothetical protein